MTMYDSIGVQAETEYRQQQIVRQYRDASARAHHVGRLNRWREARQHRAA